MLRVQVSPQFVKSGGIQIAKSGIFKLIDLDATLIINPDDCQKRQVSSVQTRTAQDMGKLRHMFLIALLAKGTSSSKSAFFKQPLTHPPCFEHVCYQKSRGPSGARLLGSCPLGLLDNVLQALRPCDPRNGAMIGQCIRDFFCNQFWFDFILFYYYFVSFFNFYIQNFLWSF